MAKVVVGLSGGVDSSVAALLLKQQGHNVTGIFMVNWHDRTGALTSNCSWEDDWLLARMVAEKIGIPIKKIDLSDAYRKRVVDYMFSEYSKGRTPNPDVLCNREIKFDSFVKIALEYGAEYVATGHYCQKSEIKGKTGKTYYQLLTGKDRNKDQSYFLCQLTQQQLALALFPIGALEKPEVRRIAAEAGLPTAERKDSQGICFVGKVDLPTFLQQQLKPKTGRIMLIPPDSPHYAPLPSDATLSELTQPHRYHPEEGLKTGTHHGAHFFTIGQRKGINVGGMKEPLFVIGIHIERNVVFTGMGKNHPGLFRKGLFIRKEDIHAVRPDLALNPGESLRVEARIRYRQPLQSATLIRREEGIYMIFDTPQRAITAGQFAAWYLEEELIGSGVIEA
ncbi:MAG: tRNA 2-thiouridine(34) synthase MnmA [Bacteroidales bacterium]|nr:tRNA 2-thiouridine(34) synthase MnmA [Bacteroidales bacterium]MDD2321980.1 tRNA 2-thiouridine(34) synthase MnmA [Bacteroidales bacterium]MDD3010291.1 tRNA 2-thiouridine(34) synthase MnmA [Bacteroidales bacterium]MDD3960854.1 tRNA 2-thiouridine(34) synthase MnmA [Bacteroidales bacterium]HPE86992.1 tRNA 2-thiouridine(34) synthase MnmA [Bacteroidales bacterium]